MDQSLFDLHEIFIVWSPPHVLEHDMDLVGIRYRHTVDTGSEVP